MNETKQTATGGSQFTDRVALVTGAGSGIGAATAIAFAAEGARVVCVDLNLDTAGATVEHIQQAGGEAIACGVDVASEDGNASMVEQACAAFGGLDIAFFNAGILTAGSLLETDVDTWDKVMAVNLRSVFLGLRSTVPVMQKRGGGAITITASVAGLLGDADLGVYATSKHGVVGLTKSAAGEFAASNVRVNGIAPGAVATPMIGERNSELAPGGSIANNHPIGRVASPQDIADMVLFLSSDRASFITGGIYPVDGGMTALADRRFRG